VPSKTFSFVPDAKKSLPPVLINTSSPGKNIPFIIQSENYTYSFLFSKRNKSKQRNQQSKTNLFNQNRAKKGN
jgi:hypothetical protein